MDLVIRPRVLGHELVAGETEDNEVFVLGGDLLVERLEGGVLRCEATFGGGVDDEDDFVFERGEVVGLALFCGDDMIVLVACWRDGGTDAKGSWKREVRVDLLSFGLKS